MVATEQIAAQTVAHKGLRRLEHLRLGPAEPVNALLGVTHNEHAGGRATATGTRVTAQPRQERLPLQRVGVLKLVNQQMLDARVQPLLHPARQHRVTQHEQGGALHVIHVDPAAIALERGKLGNQHTAQAHHALLVAPGGVLMARCCNPHDDILRSTDGGDACHFFAEFARRAIFGQQRGKRSVHVTTRQRGFQRHTFGGKRRRAGPAQRRCSILQKPKVGGNVGDEFIG